MYIPGDLQQITHKSLKGYQVLLKYCINGLKKSSPVCMWLLSIMYDYSKLVRWFENSSKAIEKVPKSCLVKDQCLVS